MMRAANLGHGRLGACIAIPLLAFFAGCGEKSDRPACYPVSGQVRQAGKPLGEAIVTLHPLTTSSEAAQKPIAYADAEGRFKLTTYQTGDGAPAGSYAITVELRAPRTVGEEIVRDGKNLLPARFSKPESTPLKFDVKEGENSVPPIDLPAR